MKNKKHLDDIPKIIKETFYFEGGGQQQIEYVRKDMHDAILDDNMQLEKRMFRLQQLITQWAEAGNILHFSLLNQKIEKLLDNEGMGRKF